MINFIKNFFKQLFSTFPKEKPKPLATLNIDCDDAINSFLIYKYHDGIDIVVYDGFRDTSLSISNPHEINRIVEFLGE